MKKLTLIIAMLLTAAVAFGQGKGLVGYAVGTYLGLLIAWIL